MRQAREKLYYSISEVSEAASVKPHVLRYWETQFKMLRPRKNRAGNRMYRPRDLNLVLTIRDLLYHNGYTIAGARKKLIDCKRQGALSEGVLAGAVEPLPGEAPAESAGLVKEDPGQLTLADAARSKSIREIQRDLLSLLEYLHAQ